MYIPHSVNLYFKMENTTLEYFKQLLTLVRKFSGWIWLQTMKVKVEHFHSQLKRHITKQLLTSMSVDIRIHLPLKVIFTLALQPQWISLFWTDTSSCLPKLKSINVQALAFQKSWRSFSPIIVCILAHCMLPFWTSRACPCRFILSSSY